MEKYLITPCHTHLIESILFLHVFSILSQCILFHNGLKMDCHDVMFLFHPNVLSPNNTPKPIVISQLVGVERTLSQSGCFMVLTNFVKIE